MSAQYWAHKLESTFVYHEGQYKQITGFRVDDEDPELRNALYPEDYLKFMKFRLDDTWYKRKDFEIRFPRERYPRINGKAVWGGRSMTKAYKLAPFEENYRLSHKRIDLKTWLNAPATRFDSPDKLWDFDDGEHILSPNLAIINRSPAERRVILSNQVNLYSLERNDTHMKLRKLKDGNMADRYKLWPGMVGVEKKARWTGYQDFMRNDEGERHDPIRGEGLGADWALQQAVARARLDGAGAARFMIAEEAAAPPRRREHFIWTYIDQDVRDPHEQWEWSIHEVDGYNYFCFYWNGEVWMIDDPNDVENIVDDAMVGEDIIYMMDREGIT